jgi:hypothetical protein
MRMVLIPLTDVEHSAVDTVVEVPLHEEDRVTLVEEIVVGAADFVSPSSPRFR